MSGESADERPRGSRYRSDLGRNVEEILCSATRVVTRPIPRAVRTELMRAVKLKALGRLKKDGLKPEVFYHPDHKHGAIERQANEAAYAASCLAKANAACVHVTPIEDLIDDVVAGKVKLTNKEIYSDG